MKINEKLKRLVEGKNKAEISRRAGLAPTALNDYAVKGCQPRYDIASRLAKSLRVPLDWLADDQAGWPPPARLDCELKAVLSRGTPEETRTALVALLELATPAERRQIGAIMMTMLAGRWMGVGNK